MEITFHRWYIQIQSDILCDSLSRLSGFTKENKGMAFHVFPIFIFIRNEPHPMVKQWINHEKIHMHQNITTFYIAFLFSQLEYLYARIFLRYTHLEAYKYESIEQEAYLNQHELDYIRKRRPLDILKYVRNKKKFHTDKDFKVVIED